MLTVLRQRNFALFWAAALTSGIGDFALMAALPYYVYAVSGSALATAIAIVSETAPVLVFSNLGGVFSDRWPRKPVIVGTEFLRAAALLPLLAVHGSSTLWIVYAAGFARASVGNFAGPFGGAAIPRIVGSHDLPSANAAFSIATWVGVIIGSPAGGLLLQHGGLWTVAIVDAVSFVLAGVLVAAVDVPLQNGRDQASKPSAPARQVWTEWIRGIQLVMGEPLLSRFFLVVLLAWLANGVVASIMAPFIRHTLGGSPQFFGWCMTAQGLGGIAGALVIGRAQARITSTRLLTYSVALLGALNMAVALIASQPAMLTGAFIAGIAVLFVVVSLGTIVQTAAPDEFRGRLIATYMTLNAAGSICGALIGGQLGNTIGPRITWGIGGAAMLFTGLVARWVLHSRAKPQNRDGQPVLRVQELP